ncbi:MAG: hypothetical protein GX639_15610 [Fibrobacter sp.]|nr:hypothetical protein [Fibrobacter sp.]
MNTIKFVIGVAVVVLALTGFIALDPAFKNSANTNSATEELSMNEQNMDSRISASLKK